MTRDDLISVGKGALIAAAGAALVYASQWLLSADFGALAPLAAALSAVLVNLARKLAEGGKDVPPPESP